MSKTFIALGDSKPAALDIGDVVTNIPFFPNIRLSQVRESQRLDSTVTMPRLRVAVVEAMASTNSELAVWADQQKSRGFRTLADVQVDQLGVRGSMEQGSQLRGPGSNGTDNRLKAHWCSEEHLFPFCLTGKGAIYGWARN